MNYIVKRISAYCVSNGIIEEDLVDLFSYAIEKRITTAISASILVIIAAFISNLWTALAYLGSFYFLRVRTSGYHAKCYFNCLCLSILLELFCLLILFPLLTFNFNTVVIFNIFSVVTVFVYAPFKHPNLHLSVQEVAACQNSARKRISILSVLAILLYLCKMRNICGGITLGNTMTALMLVVAIIEKERGNHLNGEKETNKKNGQCNN